MSNIYSSNATEGLRQISQSLTTEQKQPLCCPECKAELLVQCSGRNGRWSARHPRSSKCRLDLACWGNGETEEQLREQFAAGESPRVSNPEIVAQVHEWIARLCLITPRRNNDR